MEFCIRDPYLYCMDSLLIKYLLAELRGTAQLSPLHPGAHEPGHSPLMTSQLTSSSQWHRSQDGP